MLAQHQASAVTEAVTVTPRGRAETRDRLLTAAAELIGDVGYDRASLADIARAAQLTTGAVYSTYGSKGQLLRAVVAAQTRELCLPDSGKGLPADIHLLAEALHDRTSNPSANRLAILQLEIHLLALRNPGLLDDLVTEGREERDRLAEQLRERAVSAGKLLPLPAPELATLLTALAAGMQLLQLTDPEATPPGYYLDALRLLLGLGEVGETEDV